MFEALLSLKESENNETHCFDSLAKSFHLSSLIHEESKDGKSTDRERQVVMDSMRQALALHGVQNHFPTSDGNNNNESYFTNLVLHLAPFLSTLGSEGNGKQNAIQNKVHTNTRDPILWKESPLLQRLLSSTNSASSTADGFLKKEEIVVSDENLNHNPNHHSRHDNSKRRSTSPLPSHTKNSFSFSFKRARSPLPLVPQTNNNNNKETVDDASAKRFATEQSNQNNNNNVEQFKSMFSPWTNSNNNNNNGMPPVDKTPMLNNNNPNPDGFIVCTRHNNNNNNNNNNVNNSGNERFPKFLQNNNNNNNNRDRPRHAPPYQYGDNNNNTNNNTNSGFVSAGEQLLQDVKNGKTSVSALGGVNSTNKPNIGLRRPGFQPPFRGNNNNNNEEPANPKPTVKTPATSGDKSDGEPPFPPSLLLPDGTIPPSLADVEVSLIARIAGEIVECAGSKEIGWEDIAGLQEAKDSIEEAIVWPLRRPDLFVGLRDPPRGLLLFGPPGTGKTMIARAIANRAQCTFLNISASSLMSKWMGEGEKLVRVLFAVATVKQPSVIFIDEVDSLLSARGEGETDSVRRVKTEFLVQMDGVGTDRGERVLLIGATNRPDELDEAARRRMEKRLYIPLPDFNGRRFLIHRLLQLLEASTGEASGEEVAQTQRRVHHLTEEELDQLAAKTEGYSGADLKLLCKDAAMGPLRELGKGSLSVVKASDLRPIVMKDFLKALRRLKPSVGQSEVIRYEDWNKQFGSFSALDGEDEDEEEDEKE